MGADGPKLRGIERVFRGRVLLPFWQQVFNYTGNQTARVTGQEAVTGAEQRPIDRDAAQVIIRDDAALVTAALALPAIRVPGRRVLSFLPDVLTEVSVEFNKSSGDGQANYPVSQQLAQFLGSGSATLSPSAAAQASAAIIPSLTWKMARHSEKYVATETYFFYLQNPTEAAILSRLTAADAVNGSVFSLPVFRTESPQFKLFGGQVSIRQEAKSRASLSGSPGDPPNVSRSLEYGDEYSKEIGVSVREETIPYCLHGTINGYETEDQETVSVTVKADTTGLFFDGALMIDPITNQPITLEAEAQARVSPTSLSSTFPSDIPKTGIYLVDITSQMDELGLTMIGATVANFSQYA